MSATADNSAPDGLGDLQAVDPTALAKGWCPPVMLALNMRDFPTGLRLVGDVIWLTMEAPRNYESYRLG